MAVELGETECFTKMEGGDFIAHEVKYHLHCLTALRNCHRSMLRKLEQEVGVSSKEKKIKVRLCGAYDICRKLCRKWNFLLSLVSSY